MLTLPSGDTVARAGKELSSALTAVSSTQLGKQSLGYMQGTAKSGLPPWSPGPMTAEAMKVESTQLFVSQEGLTFQKLCLRSSGWG